MSAVMHEQELKAPAQYRDRKRALWWLSLIYPLAPLVGLYLYHVTGLAVVAWLSVIANYAVLPVLDALVGRDKNNPPESAVPSLEEDRFYRYLTYGAVPMHYITLLVTAWYLGTHEVGWLSFIGLSLSVGVAGGLAINTGHELGHKKTTLERWLAKIVLAVVGYGHFYIEHNRGHHKDVATPEDPASSRFGENIYMFALREVPGGIRRAWNTEKERLARLGKGPWTLQNEMLQPLLITVVLYGALIVAFGLEMIPFLLIQMAYGYWGLTSANYVEHYGLLRRKLPDGRYERCQPHHSWNSNQLVSNLLLFHLQRHSDHHAWPTRRYQSLRDYDDVPTLPSGYPGMFLLAMIPPAWRAVMDHRVLDWYGRDVTQVNIDPRKRERILRQYADYD